MRQLTLATGTFETHRKPTRREKFLSDMEKVVPWHDLCAVIAPYYPKGENGRPPVGLERMLRIYFLQQWFNLSDPGAEEALYESVSMCRFVGIDLGREPVPDETTISPMATSISPIRGQVKFPQLTDRTSGIVTRPPRIWQGGGRRPSGDSCGPRTRGRCCGASGDRGSPSSRAHHPDSVPSR